MDQKPTHQWPSFFQLVLHKTNICQGQVNWTHADTEIHKSHNEVTVRADHTKRVFLQSYKVLLRGTRQISDSKSKSFGFLSASYGPVAVKHYHNASVAPESRKCMTTDTLGRSLRWPKSIWLRKIEQENTATTSKFYFYLHSDNVLNDVDTSCDTHKTKSASCSAVRLELLSWKHGSGLSGLG